MKRWIGWILGYLATVLVWLSIAPYGFNPWDECVLAYGSLRVAGGQLPGIDFYGYAPARYLLGALIDRLFGPSLYALRIGFVLFTAFLPLLAYSVSRRLLPTAWALGPAVLVALLPSTYYFRSYPYCALLGAWSICRLIEAPSVRRQVLHGVVVTACASWELASGGFLMLATPLALGLAEGPWLQTRRARGLALFRVVGAALLAALPMAWPYLTSGRLIGSLRVLARSYAVGGASLWVPYPQPWVRLLAGEWDEAIQDSFFWGFVLVLASAIGYGIYKVRASAPPLPPAGEGAGGEGAARPGGKGAAMPGGEGAARPGAEGAARAEAEGAAMPGGAASKSRAQDRYFASFGVSHAAESQYLTLCLLGLLHYTLPLYRAGLFNVVRASPIPWILMAFLLHVLYRRHSRAALLALAYPVVLALHFTLSPLYRGPATGGPPGAALQTHLVELSSPRAGIWVKPQHAELIQTVCGWIDRDSSPRDALFTAPLSPLFYFLCERDNPTSQDFLLPGSLDGPASLPDLEEKLSRTPPKLVVLCDLRLDNSPDRELRVYARPLYEWFLARYAWTERAVYDLPPDLHFDLYHLLRGHPRPAPVQPFRVGGPAKIRPNSWRLPAGARVDLELPVNDPDLYLLFEAHGPEPGWMRPPLVLQQDKTVLRSLIPEDASPPPLLAVHVRGHVIVGVPASRPEYIGQAWELLNLGLCHGREIFPAREEETRPTDPNTSIPCSPIETSSTPPTVQGP